jgi:hypothetical protein
MTRRRTPASADFCSSLVALWRVVFMHSTRVLNPSECALRFDLPGVDLNLKADWERFGGEV